MAKYYTSEILQIQAPSGSFQVRRTRPAVVALVLALWLALCTLAILFGPSGPLTTARLREALVLIQTKDHGQTAYSTGWLCRPNVVVAAESAVRKPDGSPREGITVYVNGGQEKCAVQDSGGRSEIALDAGGKVTEHVGATVFTIQPPKTPLRPLLVNTAVHAVREQTPVSVCAMTKDNQAVVACRDQVRRFEQVESTHFVYLHFQGALTAAMLGAPLIDGRDGRVVGYLAVVSPGSQASTHRAVSASLIRPALEKHGVSLALAGE